MVPPPISPDEGSVDDSPVLRRPVLTLVARVLLGAIVGLAAVDVCVGFLDRGQTALTDYWQSDPYLAWVPRPHYQAEGELLDSYGMRSEEIPADASPTEVRILGTGASRLYGRGVDQELTWSYDLERMLREATDRELRVLNGAVQAYSAVQSCRRAGQLISEVQPDIVLVAVGTGAQILLDTSSARSFVRVGERLVPHSVIEGWPESLLPVRIQVHEVLSHSNLYTRHMNKLRLADEDRPEAIQRWILTRERGSPYLSEMVERSFEEVEALVQQCEREGIALRFLVLPELAQASDKRWKSFLGMFQAQGAPAIGTPRHEPTQALIEGIRARGGVTWDMTTEFDLIGNDRAKFLLGETDPHWSVKGHELVAFGLLRRMKSEGLFQAVSEARTRNPRASAQSPDSGAQQ